MDTTKLLELLDDGCTPLVRTDYTDDAAWHRVVAAVTAPVDFGTDTDDDGSELTPDDDGYTPYVTPIEDPELDGITADTIRAALPTDLFGYLLLADRQSMTEVNDLTVVYVDLHDEEIDPDEFDREAKQTRSFRCAVGEIASIEANLSIGNMDFHEFAGSVGSDAVFRGFPEPGEPDPELPEKAAGKAGSWAIAEDIRQHGTAVARDAEGNAEVVATITGTRRKAFSLVAKFCGLWGGNYSWSALGFDLAPGETLIVNSYNYDEDEGGDPITGIEGYIVLTYRDIVSPSSATIGWNWYAPPPGSPIALRGQGVRVLETDSLVYLALTQSKTEDGKITTTIKVNHHGLPAAWTEHMAAWWTWRLARIEQTGVMLR